MSNVIRGLDRTPCIEDLERILSAPDGPKININPDGSISTELSGLGKRVAELEEEAGELGRIRATLLLNFGDTRHNRFGFIISKQGSTLNMLMEVLEHLIPPKPDG